MKIVSLHNKNKIEAFLRKNTSLHLYSMGDLDSFFWKYTIWYGLKKNKELVSTILVYLGSEVPTVLIFAEKVTFQDTEYLLKNILNYLPSKFYLHITSNLVPILEKKFKLDFHGTHNRMILTQTDKVNKIDTSKVELLTKKNKVELLDLYSNNYPNNWFDERMLASKQYFGIRENDLLVSVAGVHVFSTKYKLSALGNIVTHLDYRGKGYAKVTTAKLCQSLLKEGITVIGLNVKADNTKAIKCYESIGFEFHSTYDEYQVEILNNR